ncbi:hypothetical protein REJC140_00978 [Pseudorhizobium endolithicum]|uniref:DUF1192 domain-containing protein n=1 Tax=Pseudorhizobium endolithicum TaxID=1191678 RepID=A0ABM8PPN2_9HYPH|nr:DUF1192 domain-containing protein [Pseudorhizobium endolithicum]CAD7041196.1 hypothetical protein REJC140_00978 [Pseudorhizobium endolithicum]
MTFFDEDRPKKPASHEIGSDLSALSVEDLAERIALLQGEIRRLEKERQKKAAGRRAADSLFRS